MAALDQKPEAILLDAGGVLLLPDLLAVSRHCSIDAEFNELRNAFYVAFQQLDEQLPERVWLWGAFLRQFFDDEQLVEHHIQGILDLGLDHWGSAAAGAIDFLSGLTARNIPAVVVSNSNGSVEDLLLDAGVTQAGDGPLQRVESIVNSSLVGVEKPDPRIFDIALDRLADAGYEVEREQALHIGDALWSDVRGAQAAGIPVLHYFPCGSCPEEGHIDVEDFDEVLQMIDEA